MQTFADITAAQNAIYDNLTPGSLPAGLRDKFRELRGSPAPVDTIVKMGEFLYAHRRDEGMPSAAEELCGGLIAIATANAWHGLLEDDRGNRIVQAVRRDLGEEAPSGHEWPEEGTDPAPKAEYSEANLAPPMPIPPAN